MEAYIKELENKIKIALRDIKQNKEEAENKYEELIKEKIEADKYKQKLEELKELNYKRLLNKYEETIFNMIYKNLNTKKYILWGQVAFSAFLQTKYNEQSNKDWWKYNLFYVDFLIVEKETKKPVLVIEYDGSEKHKPARDSFRDSVCRKAGIEVVRLNAIKGEIKDKDDINKMNEQDKDKYYKSLNNHLKPYIEKLRSYQIFNGA
ncbi:DUF2726 domain-containing protein [Helicobacter sp. T3_23-1056]